MVREYGLSVSFFEPFKNGVEECGENGLPVCPNTTKIIGNGHLLSLKTHPNLQELVHVEKGCQSLHNFSLLFCIHVSKNFSLRELAFQESRTESFS